MKKIILVDDCQYLIEEMRDFIESHNDSKCEIFTNPEEALNYIINNSDIDILITDYQMPKMNGIQLAKKVLEALPNIRVIISSGHDISYLKKLCGECGIYDKVEFIIKCNMGFLQHL